MLKSQKRNAKVVPDISAFCTRYISFITDVWLNCSVITGIIKSRQQPNFNSYNTAVVEKETDENNVKQNQY